MTPENDKPTAFLWAWAGTLAACLAATWRLWTPLRDTPRVAPIEFVASLPPRIDFALLAFITLGLVRSITSATRWRSGVALTIAALGALMALDQLRWQPWTYHALLAGVIVANSDRRIALLFLRTVTIAVYAWSAVSKLDAEFAATLGQQMLEVLGIAGDQPSPTLALLLPAGELLLAFTLAASLRWRRLATPAAGLAVAMHAATIGLLGPWALGHSLGVLVWNAGFAWQTFVLFAMEDDSRAESLDRRHPLAYVACGLAVVAPALTPLGLWDQWPGWALYAPGGERATLYVHDAAAERLPATLRPFVEKAEDGPWRRVRLDDWALAKVAAPLYPQRRIVAAIATGILQKQPLSERLRVVVESRAGTVSRARQSRTLQSNDEIAKASRLVGLTPGVAWTR